MDFKSSVFFYCVIRRCRFYLFCMVTAEKVAEVLNEVVKDVLIPKFYELGMNASGEWVDSLAVRAAENHGEIWGRDYTQYLVRGRKPNQNQDPDSVRRWVGWAGSTFLKKWVDDKGLSINPYAVAYSIAKEGTSYHPEGTDLLEVLNSQEVHDIIRKKLGDILRFQIKEEILRMSKLLAA